MNKKRVEFETFIATKVDKKVKNEKVSYKGKTFGLLGFDKVVDKEGKIVLYYKIKNNKTFIYFQTGLIDRSWFKFTLIELMKRGVEIVNIKKNFDSVIQNEKLILDKLK